MVIEYQPTREGSLGQTELAGPFKSLQPVISPRRRVNFGESDPFGLAEFLIFIISNLAKLDVCTKLLIQEIEIKNITQKTHISKEKYLRSIAINVLPYAKSKNLKLHYNYHANNV